MGEKKMINILKIVLCIVNNSISNDENKDPNNIFQITIK